VPGVATETRGAAWQRSGAARRFQALHSNGQAQLGYAVLSNGSARHCIATETRGAAWQRLGWAVRSNGDASQCGAPR